MFIFAPQTIPSVPIRQSKQYFPVHHIYCVGQNYAAHAIEMGTDPTREAPVFFMKPNDAIVVADSDNQIHHAYPTQTQDYHYEVELIVAIGQAGKDIALEKAADYIYGYALGLDMTKRDLQTAAKARKGPWDIAKGFDESALMTKIQSKNQTGELTQGMIELKVNGVLKQSADLNQLIWAVPDIIHYLSQYFELKAGDLIFTGTPAGVGAVQKGDKIEVHIQNLDTLTVYIE